MTALSDMTTRGERKRSVRMCSIAWLLPFAVNVMLNL